MSWRVYDFACRCGHVFEQLVRGMDGVPEACPACGATEPAAFTRQVAAPATFSTIVPTYPGAKYHKAGYGHALRRPAEKAGSQISMSGVKLPK